MVSYDCQRSVKTQRCTKDSMERWQSVIKFVAISHFPAVICVTPVKKWREFDAKARHPRRILSSSSWAAEGDAIASPHLGGIKRFVSLIQ